jgi:magnesium-transporting ATPase (P-type)
LCRVPFDAGRKRSSIVVRKPDGGVRVYTKGAPDVLFGKDADEVKDLKAQILADSPDMSEEEVNARANK